VYNNPTRCAMCRKPTGWWTMPSLSPSAPNPDDCRVGEHMPPGQQRDAGPDDRYPEPNNCPAD